MFTRILKCCEIKDMFLVGQKKPGFTSVCELNDERQQPCDDKEFAAGGSEFVGWTTGTTGLPKCVQRPESLFLGSILRHAALQILTPGDVFLGDSNISCLLIFSMWLLALHVGSAILVSKTCRTIPEDVIEALKDCEAVTMFTFPLKLRRMLNAMKASEDLAITLKKCLRKLLVIGTSTPAALAEELVNTFKLDEFRSGYGMTEAGGFLAVPPSGEVSGTNQGFPVPSTKMKVIDTDTGKILGPLEGGEVIFYTPFAATGYFGDPEAADELTDKHGWIHTGDLGYYDNDGRLFLCGRLKTLLECQSRKFPPSDIEHCLMDHEAVEEVSVLGMPPEDIQQFPAAVVVTKSGFARDHQLAEDLKRYVAVSRAGHPRQSLERPEASRASFAHRQVLDNDELRHPPPPARPH
ncbi:luciferin 4-monooxygenase [Dermacentor silvarum]|uniref:luciferin 4-monooxygenase n=1 Tax=Dermacentor silvarum TaxID=543639 RepID=UPI002101BEF9|nr:luciferin 4-monooxygenase [Dermacentor silvarum]